MDRRALARAIAFSSVTLLGGGAARPEEQPTLLVWYRSAEGCPDGPGFLQRLEARGVHGRLAAVGDPIDFVVTLGSDADGARGFLERQTKTGTVAIRRLDGGSCDEIADGLALSLSLAGAPEQQRQEPSPAPASPAPASPAPASPVAAPPSPVARASERPVAAEDSNPVLRAESGAGFAIGVQGNVLTGIAPDPLPGASLFFDFAPGGSGTLSRSSLRAVAFGHIGESSIDGHAHRTWLVGGRFEACPTSLGSPAALHVRPCASLDLGTIQTAGSGSARRTAGAFWAAARVALRLGVPLSDRFGLEAQVDAGFPFTRYEIVAGAPERTLYRTAAVGLGAGVGAYLRLP